MTSLMEIYFAPAICLLSTITWTLASIYAALYLLFTKNISAQTLDFYSCNTDGKYEVINEILELD